MIRLFSSFTPSRAFIVVSKRRIMPFPPPQGESSICRNEPPAYGFISTMRMSAIPFLVALATRGIFRNESKTSGKMVSIVIFITQAYTAIPFFDTWLTTMKDKIWRFIFIFCLILSTIAEQSIIVRGFNQSTTHGTSPGVCSGSEHTLVD